MSSQKVLLIIVVLAVAFLLLSNDQFIMSVIAPCENNEPSSLKEFQQDINELGGVVDREGNFNLVKSGGYTSYPLYKSNSDLGTIYVINPGSTKCSDLLKSVSTTPYTRSAVTGANIPMCAAVCVSGWAVVNNLCTFNSCYSPCGGFTIYDTEQACLADNLVVVGSYTLINKKQVLSTKDGFMWCNKNNNLAYLAPNLNSFNNYFEKYEQCYEPPVTNYLSTEAECLMAGGEWDAGSCYCGTTRMTVDDVCSALAAELMGEGGVNDISGPPPQTPPGEGTIVDRDTMSTDDNQRMVIIIVVLFVGLFLLYWFFEKGPDKGFIRGEKRK